MYYRFRDNPAMCYVLTFSLFEERKSIINYYLILPKYTTLWRRYTWSWS